MESKIVRSRQLLADHYLPRRDRVKYAIPDLVCMRENSSENTHLQRTERFLQILWNEQAFDVPPTTEDGRHLTIRSPGTWNCGPGPDFRDAVLCMDGRSMLGAVEIHRKESDWFAHGHHHDPAYRHVCLHVVASPSTTPAFTDEGTVPPRLVLPTLLPETVRAALADLVGGYPEARRVPPGLCAVRWRDKDAAAMRALLEAAGLSRFREKVEQMRKWIAESDANQAVYERLFDALGYQANRAPFRELAVNAPLATLRKLRDPTACSAVLYGTAGLLPDPSQSQATTERRRALRTMWDQWWKSGGTPVRTPWHTAAVRPANRPGRRLAAGLGLLLSSHFAPGDQTRDTAQQAADAKELIRQLEATLSITPERVRAALPPSHPLSETRRLLGHSRILDIILNVALPFLAADALRRHDESMHALAESAFLETPKLQTNRQLNDVTYRMFLPPAAARACVRKACHQQGLLAIHRDFCLPLGTDCRRCPLVTDESAVA